MNQALAMSVAFTAATSSVLSDALHSKHGTASQRGSRRSVMQVLTRSAADEADISHALALEELAEHYKTRSHPREAKQLYEYAIELRRNVTEAGDSQIVADLRVASELADAVGDKAAADELLQQAIETCKSHANSRL